MSVIKLTKNNYQQVIKQAKQVLERNGLVVFPSDTVYGLAANALSQAAVEKLIKFKSRPHGQSISIAVNDFRQLKKYVQLDQNQEGIIKTLLPGPYTIVLYSKKKVVKALEAEDQTLGVRLPDYWFTRELSQVLPFPYTATSANLHNKGPHYSISALLNTLSEKKKQLLDLVIDYGNLLHNLPSTVANLTKAKVQIIRQGDYNLKLVKQFLSQNEKQTMLLAQALLKQYLKTALNKPVVFILKGDLGTGKTVFTKGLGEYLGINNIVSPTYVVYYEYLTNSEDIDKLHHFDLYKIEQKQDLEILEIDKLLKPRNLLVFEWGEKIASAFSNFKSKQTKIILINLQEQTINKRKISVYEI